MIRSWNLSVTRRARPIIDLDLQEISVAVVTLEEMVA